MKIQILDFPESKASIEAFDFRELDSDPPKDELWERLGAVVEELEAIRAAVVVLHVAVSEDEGEKLISEGDKG